jgi:nitrogen regulatory protein PII
MKMHLLVLILDKPADIEMIIEKWREIGVTGATIYDSVGVGKTTLYGTDAPIIASLKRIFDSEKRTYNHTMISVIKTDETLNEAIKVAREVCGDFTKPDVGIMFSLRLDRVIGFNTPDTGSGG